MSETPLYFPLVMDEKLAALYTGVKRSFLQKARSIGSTKNQREGPRFFRIGRKVYYRRVDLDEWAATRKTQATI